MHRNAQNPQISFLPPEIHRIVYKGVSPQSHLGSSCPSHVKLVRLRKFLGAYPKGKCFTGLLCKQCPHCWPSCVSGMGPAKWLRKYRSEIFPVRFFPNGDRVLQRTQRTVFAGLTHNFTKAGRMDQKITSCLTEFNLTSANDIVPFCSFPTCLNSVAPTLLCACK